MISKGKIRRHAILCCLFYSLLPYWMYESQKHYRCSYWQHLRINLEYAWRWIKWDVDEVDYQFEKQYNSWQ
jgi:hypothetical protein